MHFQAFSSFLSIIVNSIIAGLIDSNFQWIGNELEVLSIDSNHLFTTDICSHVSRELLSFQSFNYILLGR